jgi:hypothetical protein
LQKEPTEEHPFDYDVDDWENPNNLYNTDLVVGKEKDLKFVRNVMREYSFHPSISISYIPDKKLNDNSSNE